MDKKDLQKNIKEFFTTFAKQNGFVFHKPTLMIRMHKDTLHIVNFDVPSKGFNCNIAIQPLYIPSDTVTLSFGNRLNHFKTKLSGKWGYGNDKQEVEKDLSQVKELLEVNALKWFEETGCPEGIIKFIESGLCEDINLIVGFPPVFRSMYLGFSYLYISKPELAIKPLQEVIEKYKDDNRDWVIKQNDMINSIITLTENAPHNIRQRISEIIIQTKDKLKLKNITYH